MFLGLPLGFLEESFIITPPPTDFFIKIEDGFYLLAEDNSKIIVE